MQLIFIFSTKLVIFHLGIYTEAENELSKNITFYCYLIHKISETVCLLKYLIN